jgi:hypothetical protein
MERNGPMTTECSDLEFLFPGLGGREGVARFDGGDISSDGGLPLLTKVEGLTGIVGRFARCFTDCRDPRLIQHPVRDLVAQRVYGLALGYEDLNDHEILRHDPLFAAATGKDPGERGIAPAGKSTLNRLELSRPEDAASHRYKKVFLDPDAVDRLLVDVFLESHAAPPEEIVLDLDTTDFPLHGRQEGRFFHGYYNEYCYLPLYVFCGGHLLLARVRRANQDAAAGAKEEVEKIVRRIRAKWPTTRIVLRADSGFCREELMAFCEKEGLFYVFGLARNSRLEEMVASELAEARFACETTGLPHRVFKEFGYSTLKTWSRHRRVIAKAEHLPARSNPRFLVTNFPPELWQARALYEDLYCGRGDMENRIKEQQMGLFADRVSAATLMANQVRVYFSAVAYALLHALRRLGAGNLDEIARAQAWTLRLKLLKVGAQVRVTVRRVWISLSSSWPYAALFAAVYANLQKAAPLTG